MEIKKNSVVEIEKGLNFVVLDVKEIQGKRVALLQCAQDTDLRFAIEKIDQKSKEIKLFFVDDKELEMKLAEEFDKK